jgi:hypothetical protein
MGSCASCGEGSDELDQPDMFEAEHFTGSPVSVSVSAELEVLQKMLDGLKPTAQDAVPSDIAHIDLMPPLYAPRPTIVPANETQQQTDALINEISALMESE